MGVLNASRAELVRYDYEPYGYPRKTTYASGISALDRRACDRNPIRRKGYYLDQSTGFYYLQSRYYSPYAARFLTADDPAYLGANGDFTSYNLFTYCGNKNNDIPKNGGSPNSKIESGGSFGEYDANGNLSYRVDTTGHGHFMKGIGKKCLPHIHRFEWKWVKGAWRYVEEILPYILK